VLAFFVSGKQKEAIFFELENPYSLSWDYLCQFQMLTNPIQSNPTQPNPTQPNPTQPKSCVARLIEKGGFKMQTCVSTLEAYGYKGLLLMLGRLLRKIAVIFGLSM